MADRMLPAKFLSTQFSVSQFLPKQGFSISQLFSEMPCIFKSEGLCTFEKLIVVLAHTVCFGLKMNHVTC